MRLSISYPCDHDGIARRKERGANNCVDIHLMMKYILVRKMRFLDYEFFISR